jgi:hypothetical protein
MFSLGVWLFGVFWRLPKPWALVSELWVSLSKTLTFGVMYLNCDFVSNPK